MRERKKMRLVYRGNARQRRNAESIKSHWLFRQFSGFFHFSPSDEERKIKLPLVLSSLPASSRSCHSHKLALHILQPPKSIPSNKENRKHTKWKWAWFSMQSREYEEIFSSFNQQRKQTKVELVLVVSNFFSLWIHHHQFGWQTHKCCVYPSIRSIGGMSQTDPLTQPSRSFCFVHDFPQPYT